MIQKCIDRIYTILEYTQKTEYNKTWITACINHLQNKIDNEEYYIGIKNIEIYKYYGLNLIIMIIIISMVAAIRIISTFKYQLSSYLL